MAEALTFGTVSEFIGAIAWPLVTTFLVLLLLGPIKKLLARDDVKVSVPGGFQISAKSQQAAAGALVTASLSKSEPADANAVQNKVEAASELVTSLGRRPRVLWVDDRPSNNRYEKAAMEALGFSVELSTSTDDAVHEVKRNGPYDVIVSDMGRPPDPRAGYTLLDKLRATGDRTPFIIYASSRAAEHFDEAVRHGALGATNMPTELLDMAVQAIRLAQARKSAGSS